MSMSVLGSPRAAVRPPSRSRRMATRGVLLVALLTVAGPTHAATLFDLFAPPGAPGPGPRDAASLWRVPVVGRPAGARCADGSDPVLYVRAAPPGSAHANDWIFHMSGGGSGTDPDRLLASWMNGEKNELSSRWADESLNAGGMLSGAAANPFRGWNVAKIDKCTMDRYQGTRQVALRTTVDAPQPGGGVVPAGTDFDLWFHGALIVSDAVDLLRNGNVTYVDRGGLQVTMPDLDDARTVLWTGSSGGSRAATMTADWAAESLLPPSADVKLVADAWFYPGAEMLADAQANGWLAGSIYDGVHGFDAQAGTSSDTYYDTGARAVIDTFGAHQVVDQSCLTFHLGEQWKCFDELHVLMHHVARASFIRQDLYDRGHLTPCWQVAWRANEADCYLPGASPLTDARRLATVVQWQLADLAQSIARREEPTAAAPIGFGPRCGQHVGLTHDGGFFVQGIVDPASGTEITFAAALDAWVQGAGVTLVETSPLNNVIPVVCQ
jgi:hypothetical protein